MGRLQFPKSIEAKSFPKRRISHTRGESPPNRLGEHLIKGKSNAATRNNRVRAGIG